MQRGKMNILRGYSRKLASEGFLSNVETRHLFREEKAWLVFEKQQPARERGFPSLPTNRCTTVASDFNAALCTLCRNVRFLEVIYFLTDVIYHNIKELYP